MKNNSFKLMTTLLLCASTQPLICEQSISYDNRIQPQDLNKDLSYIEKFLMGLHNENFLITGEEFQSINHDLCQIKKHIKRIADSDYKVKNDLAKKVVYLQKVTNTQKRKADQDEKNKKLKPAHQKPKKEMSLAIVRRTAPLLTKEEGKKEDKKKKLQEEFGMFLFPSSSNSNKPIEQSNASKNENIKPNTETNNTPIFIENLTNKPLIIQYALINEPTVITQEIAPGQKSGSIDKNNIKNLFYHSRGASNTNAIDISIISRSTTIKVKSRRSISNIFSGDSYTVEP